MADRIDERDNDDANSNFQGSLMETGITLPRWRGGVVSIGLLRSRVRVFDCGLSLVLV